MKSPPYSAVQQQLGRGSWGPSSQAPRKQLQIKITQFISRKVAAATLPLLEPKPRPWETGRDSHSKAAEKQIVPKSPEQADGSTDLAGCPCKQQLQGPASLSWMHTGQGWAQQELTHSSSIPSLWPVHLQVEHLYSEPPQRSVNSSTGSSWGAGGAGEGERAVTEAVPFQSAREISLFVRELPGWPLAPQGRSAQLSDTALDIKQTLSNQPDAICWISLNFIGTSGRTRYGF